jgi:hypothetical protein
VADALIFHAQRVVERTFRTEDKQILIGDSKAEAAITEPLGLFGQNERAGGGEFAFECGRSDFELDFRHGEANYRLRVRKDPSASVRLIRVNDQQLETDWIPLVRDPSQNEIVIMLPCAHEPIEDANEASVHSTGRLVGAE